MTFQTFWHRLITQSAYSYTTSRSPLIFSSVTGLYPGSRVFPVNNVPVWPRRSRSGRRKTYRSIFIVFFPSFVEAIIFIKQTYRIRAKLLRMKRRRRVLSLLTLLLEPESRSSTKLRLRFRLELHNRSIDPSKGYTIDSAFRVKGSRPLAVYIQVQASRLVAPEHEAT